MAKKTGTAQADTLIGTAKADELSGLAGNDVLKGGAGNDLLDGGAGDDDLQGGAGDDLYVVDNLGDINKSLTDAGHDYVFSLITYTLGNQQETLTLVGKAAISGTGNKFANTLNGNEAANILSGLGGDDILDGRKGIDDLRGGAGNDLYLIDNVREIDKSIRDDGRDQVQTRLGYTLGAFQEQLVLLGSAAITGIGNDGANFIQGNDGANSIRGMGGDDDLLGGKGNDVLDGGAGKDFLSGEAGSDTLRGGAGDDTYRLDGTLVAGVAIDTAAEIGDSVDEGIDTVQVNFDYTLGAHQENLTFYGTAGRSGTGNASANEMHGIETAGNDLSGLGGNDKLFGGSGADHLVGGEGDDQLAGFGGADLLEGDDGDDKLFGGAGDDHLIGGKGNDEYFIDDAGDIDAADADDGRDLVNSSITYTLLAGQEDLVLLSTAGNANGTGNTSANVIFGNSGANVLHGLGGDDQLIGNGGADSLFGDEGNDILHYNANATIIDGGAGASDALFLVGSGASVTLDLTAVADTIIKDIEIIRFAVNTEAVNQTHDLTLNAGDVLALSSTTDILQILGEGDDSVHLTGGGWSDAGLLTQNFHRYTNGTATVLVELPVHVDLT